MTITGHISDTRPVSLPAVGASAPDVTLHDDSGQTIRFSDRWAAAPRGLVLVFIRHFG